VPVPEQKTKVIAYSGYRGEVTPKKFILHGKQIEVVEILSRWIEEGSVNRVIKRFFRVKGNEGSIHRIYYDDGKLEWSYEIEPRR
jgi:hypothetical protein